jgi:hypothetical protein
LQLARLFCQKFQISTLSGEIECLAALEEALGLAKVASDHLSMPILIRLLQDSSDSHLQREAALGLEALRPSASKALIALEGMRDDEDDDVPAAVEEAIAAISVRAN